MLFPAGSSVVQGQGPPLSAWVLAVLGRGMLKWVPRVSTRRVRVPAAEELGLAVVLWEGRAILLGIGFIPVGQTEPFRVM